MQPFGALPAVSTAANQGAPIVVPLKSVVEKLDVAGLFARRAPIEVELGSGDGSFLAELAARCPDRNFIGVERLLGRLRKLERKSRRLGLTNLRAVRLEAGYFVQYLLPAGSIGAFHIYFPDPWPKRRHQARRLVNDRTAEHLRRALSPGGSVFLRTDNPDYFAQITSVFRGHAGYRPVETPEALAQILTDFEQDFLRAGRPTLRAAFQRWG